MAAIYDRPRTMLEVYRCLPEGVPIQLINNQLIMSPAPNDPHQQIIIDLSSEINFFVKKQKFGKTRVAPSDVYFNLENVFQPDIYFVSNSNAGCFERDGFHGVPDFVIEILSPGNKKYDEVEKFKIYEAAGVKEYWLVEPDTKTATGYINTNGRFKLYKKETGKLSSKILNTVFEF
jgi:Uma2 family endonuclease